MPDANAVAASHDIVQILFYFVCGLGVSIGIAMGWFAKYMLIPARDRHFSFIDHQQKFMDKIEQDNSLKMQMHRDNIDRLARIEKTQDEIKVKIRCPVPTPPREVSHG